MGIAETIIQTTGAFLIFIVKVANPGYISVMKAVTMLLYLGVSIYFILSVYSYYIIIRIQKRSVIQFLDHEFEATEVGFHRPRSSGHQRSRIEKSVPMSGEEDRDREHVLYARMG